MLPSLSQKPSILNPFPNILRGQIIIVVYFLSKEGTLMEVSSHSYGPTFGMSILIIEEYTSWREGYTRNLEINLKTEALQVQWNYLQAAIMHYPSITLEKILMQFVLFDWVGHHLHSGIGHSPLSARMMIRLAWVA